jgi:uncharacterized delta-60 repeat protein
MARPRLKSAVAVLSALLTLGLATGLAVAGVGDLDPSFDGDGRQTTDFTVGGEDRATDVAVQSDGKIIAVGRDDAGNFALARYNPDGSPDAGFSNDGKLVTPLQDSSFQRPGVAIQADGKIVVAGGHLGDFALARYMPDGNLDKSFGGTGTVTTDFASGPDYAVAVAIQKDGKIVAAGNADDPNVPGQGFALARYDDIGRLDDSFAGDGREVIGFPGSDFQRAEDMAIQGDGRFVMAGSATFPTNDTHFALARFDGTGTLDKTFDTDGLKTTPVGGGGAQAVAIAPGDSKIVAAGSDGAGDFALTSYNGSDGSTDTGFGVGGDGIATADFGGNISADARGVAVQPDGKIVAAGEADDNGQIEFAIGRFEPDGDLDASFSGDGRQTTAFPNVAAAANDLTLQADGKPVAVGATTELVGGDFALVRYQATDDPPPPPPPGPPPPPPPPPDRLTLADLPDPVRGRTTNVEPVRGRVFINAGALAARGPAQASQKGIDFVPLTEARQIPVGSFLDTRRGTVRLQSARDRRGTRQQGDFGSGLFQVLQSRRVSARGLTDLVLKGSSFSRCRGAARGKSSARAAQSRLVRRLRSNARGRFRTRGRHSAATVRGTTWLTADRCDGTLTRVTRGRVAVRDFRRKKTVLVRAGKSYLARARR